MNENEVKENPNLKENEQNKSVSSPLTNSEQKSEPEQKEATQTPKPENKINPLEKIIKGEEPKKNKEKDNGLSEDEKLLMRTGGGVNLVPKKSKAEVKKEQKKISFSLSSMISLTLLVVLSLGVVFFNIFSKRQLKIAQEDLYEKEVYLQAYTDKYLSNEEILERVDLYREVQRGVFSPREVVEYVMAIIERESNVEITSFNLTDSLEFEISGYSPELISIAKVWYLLGVDENIDNINLSAVSKNETGARFTFEGELNTDKFINK